MLKEEEKIRQLAVHLFDRAGAGGPCFA